MGGKTMSDNPGRAIKRAPKNKAPLIILSFGIILALIAVWLIANFLTPKRTTVYVFNNGYKAGTEIKTTMLTAMQVDSTLIVAGNETSLSGYFITSDNISKLVKAGDTLRFDVGKGKPFMASDIASYGTNEVEVRLAETSIGITIAVDNITGVTPNLKAESHVNVYSAQRNGLTQLILENIRVIAVNNSNGALSSVTLELNNDQAKALISAKTVGTIQLGIVNGNGYQYVTADSDATSEYIQDEHNLFPTETEDPNMIPPDVSGDSDLDTTSANTPEE